MNNARRFQVRFEVDGQGKVQAELQGISREASLSADVADRAGKAWGSLTAKLAGVVTLGSAAAAFALIARNTMQAQQELAQLEAVLVSTGGAAGMTRDQLVTLAETLSRGSVFSSGEIIEAQTRLLSYSGVIGENIPRAMQIVIDQSARLGVSLTQSAETIGRALESPTKAAAALAQQGFGAAFTDEVRSNIAALEAAGRAAEAQAVVMEILEESYDRAALAQRETFGGALKALKNTLNDLTTGGDGSLDGATRALNQLIDTLNDPAAREGFAAITEGMLSIASASTKAMAWMGNALAALIEFYGEADRRSTTMLRNQRTELETQLFRTERQAGRNAGFGQKFAAVPGLGVLTQAIGGVGAVVAQDQAARLRKEIAEIDRILASRSRDLATPPAAARPGAVGAGAADLINPDLQKQIDQVKAQAEAYGLSAAALANLNRERALAAATNDTERAAINEAYGSLIKRIEADERSSTATRASTEAQREAAAQRRQLERQYDGMIASLQEEIALHGETGRAAQVAYLIKHGALAALEPEQQAELERLAKLRDAQLELARAQQETQRLVEGTRTPAERRDAELARLEKLRTEDPDLDFQTFSRAVAQVEDEYTATIERLRQENRTQVEAMLEDWGDLGAGIDYATAAALDQLSQALTDLVVDGEVDIERLGDSIIRTFTRVMMDKAVASFFESMGGGGSGGASGGGFWAGVGNWMAGLFGGGRASGGGVSGSRIYEVTEQGKPELLRQGGRTYLLPGQDGVVMPASQAAAPGYSAASGGRPVQVQINNYAGANVQQREERQAMPDGTELSRVVVDIIADDMASGGRSLAALKARTNVVDRY